MRRCTRCACTGGSLANRRDRAGPPRRRHTHTPQALLHAPHAAPPHPARAGGPSLPRPPPLRAGAAVTHDPPPPPSLLLLPSPPPLLHSPLHLLYATDAPPSPPSI